MKQPLNRAQLKEWRLNRCLSQAEAAALVGAGSYRTWQDWERGVSPLPRWLIKMVKLLDRE